MCLEPHAQNCTSVECCSIGDYEFYPGCEGLESSQWSTRDDGSCNYADSIHPQATYYNSCNNRYLPCLSTLFILIYTKLLYGLITHYLIEYIFYL